MKKLSWDEIRKEYDQEWVHLIDYDWDESDPYPKSGVVHLHAKTRKEFDKLMITSDPIAGARIYVGDIKNTTIERRPSMRVLG